MEKLLDFMFTGFWPFIGGLTIIYLVLKLVLILTQRLFRVINLLKNGYPPPHCDADGDFLKIGNE